MRYLPNRWEREARKHEDAAEEIEGDIEGNNEEHSLHLEVARTLRNCAKELREAAEEACTSALLTHNNEPSK